MSTHLTNQPRSLFARWRRYWYLERVDTWLWTMPRRQRKAVIAELKQNLTIAATEHGMVSAIEELGTPRALAAQYLDEAPQQGPVWAYGLLAGTIVFAVWLYAMMIYVFGALDALLASPTQEPVHLDFLGVNIIAEASDTCLGATFSGFSWPALIVIIVAFLGFSRVWRIARHRRVAR